MTVLCTLGRDENCLPSPVATATKTCHALRGSGYRRINTWLVEFLLAPLQPRAISVQLNFRLNPLSLSRLSFLPSAAAV